MSKFKADTADGLSFEISSEILDGLDITDNGDGSFHLIYNNKSYNIELLESNYLEKKYVLNINEKEISVGLKDELDLAIEKMGFSSKKAESGGQIYSPMPGLVIRLEKQEGDEAEEGDVLMILEAMKMENIIKSPFKSVVKKIHVKEGETVSKRQLLIELEG